MKVTNLPVLFTSMLAVATLWAVPVRSHAFFTPAPCDKVTASGAIVQADGTTASFAATGGCKNGRFWGSVSFVDESSGVSFSSAEIAGYLWDPAQPDAREICGVAVNGLGEDVFFRARLVDRGEPGKNDAFGLAIDNRVTSGERFFIVGATALEEGNVQLHKANRSTRIDPALAGRSEFQMCGDLDSPQ